MKIVAFGMVALVGVVLTGCTVETYRTVPEEAVERAAADSLEKQVGERPDVIDCPGGLQAEVNKSIRCILTEGDTQIGLTVSVTAAEGSDITYDVKVDETATP